MNTTTISEALRAWRAKHQAAVCHAVLFDNLPDAALSWPWMTAKVSNVIVGSGESSSWQQYFTITIDGKRHWRGTPWQVDSDKPMEKLGKLHKITKELYAIEPTT